MLPCRAAALKGLGNSRLEATDDTPADFAGAAQAFEEAVSLDPNDEELPGLAAGALKEVGKTQMAAGDDAEPDFRAAAATFAKAAAIDPRYPRPRTHHSHPGPFCSFENPSPICIVCPHSQTGVRAYSDEEAAALKAEAEEAAGIAPEAEPEPEEGGE